MNSTQGKHVIVEVWNCPSEFLNNEKELDKVFTKGIELSGATIIGRISHKFHPQGVSGIYLLSESHNSFHSWLLEGYISVDSYTCGNCDPMIICEYFQEYCEEKYKVKPKLYVTELRRGLEVDNHFYHEIKSRF